MTKPLNYEALRAKTEPRGKHRKFDPETAAKRDTERGRRNSVAAARASSALAHAYPDDYRALYLAAKQEGNAERGPLPGDAPYEALGTGGEVDHALDSVDTNEVP